MRSVSIGIEMLARNPKRSKNSVWHSLHCKSCSIAYGAAGICRRVTALQSESNSGAVQLLDRKVQHALSSLMISFPVAEDMRLLIARMRLSTAAGKQRSESMFCLHRLDFENFWGGGRVVDAQSESKPSSDEVTASQLARSSVSVAVREWKWWVCI